MGFNLKRWFPHQVITSEPVYSEKRLVETVDNGKTIVSVVDCDLSKDNYPPYDSFPLEAQLASGVPLQSINPTVITDNSPSSVASRVDKILGSESSSSENENK